ncbi:hypothetical protein [Sulfobacillus thermosulfidooxidans]|uniref:hypothetical protein n=1 Tax=Sulfobacillus thermosulfidooxidans TaxID=28034 RepID=UPI00037F31EE|nr:hypothetical protein [Sulfobacillus thermosulfidooxidans]
MIKVPQQAPGRGGRLRWHHGIVRSVARMRLGESGQSEWVGQVMILGIVVIVAVVVFAFWKAGGSTWVNSQLQSITSY